MVDVSTPPPSPPLRPLSRPSRRSRLSRRWRCRSRWCCARHTNETHGHDGRPRGFAPAASRTPPCATAGRDTQWVERAHAHARAHVRDCTRRRRSVRHDEDEVRAVAVRVSPFVVRETRQHRLWRPARKLGRGRSRRPHHSSFCGAIFGFPGRRHGHAGSKGGEAHAVCRSPEMGLGSSIHLLPLNGFRPRLPRSRLTATNTSVSFATTLLSFAVEMP